MATLLGHRALSYSLATLVSPYREKQEDKTVQNLWFQVWSPAPHADGTFSCTATLRNEGSWDHHGHTTECTVLLLVWWNTSAFNWFPTWTIKNLSAWVSPLSSDWDASLCSAIRINISAITLAKDAANHICVDCQPHYYKQMAARARQCRPEKTDIISN